MNAVELYDALMCERYGPLAATEVEGWRRWPSEMGGDDSPDAIRRRRADLLDALYGPAEEDAA